MNPSDDMTDLKTRLEDLRSRIAERREEFGGTAVPFADTEWDDIVARHEGLNRRIAEMRSHDASSLEVLRADIEALALSFDDWMKNIDGAYARQQQGRSAGDR